MTPLSHNQYIKLFSDIATAHRSINSYHVGDLDNYTANESDALNPVTLWVIVNDDTIEGKVDKPKYSFVVLDYVNQDSSNLDEVLSDTLRISKDVVSMLRQPYYETFFKLEESVTFNPFNEKFDSDVAGWQFDLIFNQSFLYDACEVNTTGLPSINYETITINTPTYEWGGITGTLSSQTDLQAALDLKVPKTYLSTPTAAVIGYVPNKYYMRQNSQYTLLSQTAAQPLFNGTPNGRITLPVGVYKISGQIYLTSMSTTSGNASFSMVSGTGTATNYLMHCWGVDTSPISGISNQNGSGATTNAFPSPNMVAATAAARMIVTLTGSFEVTVAGTFIPSIALTTAAAAVSDIGTMVEIECIGVTGTPYAGNWD